MDWLSIVIAILVFVVPALLERDKKKKQRERWKEADLPDREDVRKPVATTDGQREFAPVEGRDLTEDPYRTEAAGPEGMPWDVTDVSDYDVPTVRPASSADAYGKRPQAPSVSTASAVPPVPGTSSVSGAPSGSYVTDSHSVYAGTDIGGVSAVRPVPATVQEGPAGPVFSGAAGSAVFEPAGPAGHAIRRKHRFNARDMVIYSEIMHPKYLENQGK